MSKKDRKQNKKKAKKKYIKDKAIVDFILQHSIKEPIDFSKIKIPSFLDSNTDDEKSTIITKSDSNKNYECFAFKRGKNLPIFGFSLLNEFSSDNNSKEAFNFKSSLF